VGYPPVATETRDTSAAGPGVRFPYTAAMVAQQHRVLAGSLAGGVLVLAVAMWFVLGSADDALAAPPLALLVALPVVGVVVHVVLDVIGYRPAPLDPALRADEAAREAMVRYQTGTVLRFAVSESVAIVAIAASFVVSSGGYLLVLGGCAVTLVLVAVHVWPWRRPVDRTATALERDGARSGLRETFGVGASGGVIREL